MKSPVLFYSTDMLGYDFGPQHPLQPIRYQFTYDLLDGYGLIDEGSIEVVSPPPASDSQLEAVHDVDYVQAVRRAGQHPGSAEPRAGLGTSDNPTFANMHEISSEVAGGSIDAARRVLSGDTGYAFNMAGGLHHAHRNRASGFCIYNDPAIAIAWLLKQGVDRIAYIDTDAHHGDGVQWLFYEDPRVMTASVHESGRFLFPGTGGVDEVGRGAARGTSINVPLDPLASDADLLFALDEAVLPIVRRFRPEFLVLQHGCDAHLLDPLTHLECSLNVFPEIAKRERALALEVSGGRAIGGGGGGYAFREVVPRAWAAMFAVMSGIELTDALPTGWRSATKVSAMTLSDTIVSHPPLDSTVRSVRALFRELGFAPL